jgi:hypothetical protein
MADIDEWLVGLALKAADQVFIKTLLGTLVEDMADFKGLTKEDIQELFASIDSAPGMVKAKKNKVKNAVWLVSISPDAAGAGPQAGSAPPSAEAPLPMSPSAPPAAPPSSAAPSSALDTSSLLVGDLQEDLQNMNPIYGLSETPKVGLEEAIQGTGLLGLEGCVMLALMFADSNQDAVLDREEVASLNMYTMQSPFYPALNKALGTKDRSKIIPFFKYLRLALGAMYKCPLVKATFSRGIKNPNLANYYEGRPNFVWWAFTSSTNKIAVTKQFLGEGPRMLFIIDGAGVDISKYSSFPEAEVLVLPGTLLQVQGVLAEAGGLTITHLRQLPSPPLLDFVHPGLVSALGAYQAVVASGNIGAAEALTKQVSCEYECVSYRITTQSTEWVILNRALLLLLLLLIIRSKKGASMATRQRKWSSGSRRILRRWRR